MILYVAALVLLGVSIRRLSLLDPSNPSSLFIGVHLVLLYMGGMYSYLYAGRAPLDPRVPDLLGAALLSFLVGAHIATAVFGKTRSDLASGPRLQWPDEISDRVRRLSQALLVGSVIVLVTAMVVMGSVPLLDADAEASRVAARSGLGPLIVPALNAGIVAAVAGRFAIDRSGGLTRRQMEGKRLALLGMLCVFSLVALGIGNRGPALFPFAAWIIAGWISNKRRLAIRAPITALAVLVIVAILAVVRARLQVQSAQGFLSLVLWRPYVGLYNLSLLVRAQDYGLLEGLSLSYWIDALTVLPGASPNFGERIKQALGLEFAGGGVTVGYVGELLVNFGHAGVVVGSAIYGTALQSAFLSLSSSKRPLDPYAEVLSTMIALVAMSLVTVSAVSALLNKGIFIILFAFMVLRPLRTSAFRVGAIR